MHSAIQHFRSNIERVRAVGGLYEGISHLTTSAIDATDLLRAQIVLAVSALDHYIHEVTRLGMIEVFNGVRTQTNAFRRFQVTIDAAMAGLANPGFFWFENEVREKHSYLAFQHPDKIADAIRLFSSCELWPAVASRLGMTVPEVKAHLILIVDRRNKIAHEADLDPTYPGTRWPISIVDTTNAVDFIEKICKTIHSVIT
ncbi:MAG TPA: HEPN domain-containing protein [Syntrophales bacterium]|nr:HEPN domain-containing protein [Syntrophales bacterium]